MSDQSNCLICDNRWPMPIVEYLTPTENNCKRCLLVFEQAEELLQVQPSAKSSHNIREAPTQIAATLINLARPLEALNFCLSSLDISNKACPAHPSYDRRSALDDLMRYDKSDLDPNLPPQIKFEHAPSSYLLFTFALAAFKVFGTSPFTASCLHRSHHANSTMYEMLADLNPMNCGHGQNGGFKYLQFRPLWAAPEIQQWLSVSRAELEKRFCDAIECEKVEGVVGEWKVCGGCKKGWYCSVECQKRDWQQGGHKKFCREKQDTAKLIYMLSGVKVRPEDLGGP